jgi:alpha-L-arabinofuranosidase
MSFRAYRLQIALLVLFGIGHLSTPLRPAFAQPITITISSDKPGAKINPQMWGAFFEDINFGADGGLYAEMVKNGAFEFPEPMMGWIKISPSNARGEITTREEEPFRASNPHHVRIASTAGAPLGISNEGYRGMGVRAGEAYDFSARIRRISGRSRVSVEIVGSDGTTLASENLGGLTPTWSRIMTTLRPNATDPKARMTVIVQGEGTIDLDMISLFPQKTWKNRPGGLRADMVQLLADLKPAFLRFPGGCIVEGSDLSKRYQWKNTIGPIEDRKLLVNRWNYEFKHRPTPDYYQSFGLGFFEFFQLSEDIGAEPLPIVNCGMACQFNSNELCPLDQLDTYIQDAVDLIEFANGPATSKWGAERVAMGHPAPFNMKMIGIGNEQWGPQYIERLERFTKVLKEKHPEIAIISAAGPSPADERYRFLWPKLQEMKADIVDEHCYANPIWFLSSAKRFDSYDRNGPKVFFGEYAAQSVAIVSTKNRNNLECALSEAAFMTGIERNADIVRMASYAPLFAHVDAWQWTPNLMWVDNLRVVATPNYYVQQLFSHNRGDIVLPVTNDAPVREFLPAGKIGVGTAGASAEFDDVKVVKGDQTLLTAEFAQNVAGWSGRGQWRAAEGVYRQGDPRGNSHSLAGDTTWSNYTLTLRARKTGGDGAMVITVCDDDAGTYARWILGGWENKQHGMLTHYAEQDQLLERVPGSLENNRWYDVKITVNGAQMECYLDGQLVQKGEILRRQVPALFASAVRDEKTGETILKVVNPGSDARDATIKLSGVKDVVNSGKSTILSGNRLDENQVDQPATVVPRHGIVTGVAPEFKHTFPAQSFTVLRLQTE